MNHPQNKSAFNHKALIAYSNQNPTYAKALKLAVKMLEGRTRPFTHIKYVSHAMTVGSLLIEVKADLRTMIASALQDLVSKSQACGASLSADYGADCVDLAVALQIGPDVAAFASTLAQADPAVHTILTASVLDEVCSIPTKSIKTPEARVFLDRAVKLTPALTKADPELHRRLSLVVRTILLSRASA